MAAQPSGLIKSPEIKDNETNQLTEEHVPSAINMVLANPEQSYDQFMDSFLYLKRDDVDEYLPEIDNYPEENAFDRLLKEEAGDTEHLAMIAIKNEETSPQPETPETKERDGDDLETEELGEGDNSLTTRRQRLPQQKYVKVDNFLDNMSSDDPSFEDISNLLEESVNVSPRIDAKKIFTEMKDSAEEQLEDDESQDRGLKYIPKFVSPLPGESDPTEENPDTNLEIHETKLTFGNCEEDSVIKAEELQSDEVQPFTLDPDFDYDNVKLTPKWDHLFSPGPS